MTSVKNMEVSPPLLLEEDEFTTIRLWIHKWGAANPEVDQLMTEQCEEVLKRVFSRNGFELHEKVSESELMSEIQFSLTPHSIAVPMRFFAEDKVIG